MKFPFLETGELGPEEFIRFPEPESADMGGGLIALGGNLSPGVLLSAYKQGVFPWYSRPPIQWFSPDPRFVVFFHNVRLSESMRRLLKKQTFRFTCDHAFEQVIKSCASIHLETDGGTWITGEMRKGYVELHHLGFAHSIEVWKDNELVGGLYGVSIGRMFFGESMFHTVSNASKAAFYALVNHLRERDIAFIDSQVANPHMESLGGTDIPRAQYLKRLKAALASPPPSAPWKMEIDPRLPALFRLLGHD